MQGDFGKPRPALIIQADRFSAHATVTVLPLTDKLTDIPLLRVRVGPDAENGLRKPSQVMIDKAMTVRRDKAGGALGRVTPEILLEIDRRLAVFLEIAG